MDYKAMTIEEMETRKAQIATECEAEGADLTALDAEVRAINAEIETRKAAEAKRAELRKLVADGAGKAEAVEKANKSAENVRNSKEYIDAFARYIKSGDPRECRALLTENATNGTIAVPELVDEIIRTAWERDEIVSRVRKTYLRGNVKVGFERSADPAYAHAEGTTAVTEESLTLGIVTMIPQNIKKWIKVSDEAVDMGGEAFLRYIYAELTYRIVKALADAIVNDIATGTTGGSATKPAVAAVTEAPGVTTVATALSALSDEARDNVIIMNRLTYAAFKAAQAAANFAIDPFEGLTVLFNNSLPAYSAASAGDVYAIVGDLGGAQVNYPNGDGVVIKYDENSLAEADMVKILGRQYAAHAITAPGRFTNILKPSAVTT